VRAFAEEPKAESILIWNSKITNDIDAAIILLINPKIEWRGVYFLRNYTIFNPTFIVGYNACEYENNWQFIGKIGQQFIVDVEGLDCYKARYTPFAVDAKNLSIKNNFVFSDIYTSTLHPGSHNWNMDLEWVKSKKSKAVCFNTEHFSFIGDLDSPNLKESTVFFDFCKENKVPVIVAKNPSVFSEFRNYYAAEQIQKYGGVHVALLFDCALTKLAWLIGQGLEYEDLYNEMKRNIKGEFGRFVVV